MTLRRLAMALLPLTIVASSAATPPLPRNPPADYEATKGLSTLGLAGWKVLSSDSAAGSGAEISTPGYSSAGWLNVKPDDAGAPGTEIGALLQNGACPDVFYSNNMQKCFGYQDRPSPVSSARFKAPWWFRTDFSVSLRPDQQAKLIVNGVVGEADVWVDGRQVASRAEVQGAFTRYLFDITGIVHPGANAVALAVYANDPSAMFTLDHVDWLQVPPDNNTGLKFPVQLLVTDVLSVDDAHVLQASARDMSTTDLTVKAAVTNSSPYTQSGTVTAIITPPGGRSAIPVDQPVTVPPHSALQVVFAPSRYPALRISHPQLWWPYQMGDQPLYRLEVSVGRGGVMTGWSATTFAIRSITTYLTPPTSVATSGSRVFAINGRQFLFRAGGWSEGMFLSYSKRDTANQISLIKNIGLNGIRLEGHEMPDDFYAQMDQAGIMIDAGFQCCDKWQPASDSDLTEHDLAIIHQSAVNIGRRLRNHPSVINYSWSDTGPRPRQEKETLDALTEADFQEPVISSSDYVTTPILGASGEKEGPYDWVPPIYWYDQSHFSGGEWGFNSEQSAGLSVPTARSLRGFLSPDEQSSLWQDAATKQYHTNPAGYANSSPLALNEAISHRYGSWLSFESYVKETQVQNYEDVRAQFEAAIAHSRRDYMASTGLVYWQLNKGWPTLLWDLYNNDYDQAGSYFGAKKANQGIHAFYAYDDAAVGIANLTGTTQQDLSIETTVRDAQGHILDEQQGTGIDLRTQDVLERIIQPRLPAGTAARVFFVDLVLKQRGVTIDRNVYWLSTVMDAFPWDAGNGAPGTAMTHYADFSSLQDLPTAAVSARASTRSEPGTGGRQNVTTVTVSNESSSPVVGFFLRADILRGDESQVLPVFWNDNDITIWPGESQELTASYDASLLNGTAPKVIVSGWNVPEFTAAG